MEVSDAIKTRRSVRKFEDEPVSDEDLEKILEAARWAPSSGNTQPLEIVVTGDSEKKQELAKAAYDQSFVSEAPVVIAICANIPRTKGRYGKRADRYVVQDTAAATQNLLLMAHSLGYSTCWVGSFKDEEVSKVIEAPNGIRPLAIVPLGVAAETPDPPGRRPLEGIIHEDSFP